MTVRTVSMSGKHSEHSYEMFGVSMDGEHLERTNKMLRLLSRKVLVSLGRQLIGQIVQI